MTWIPFLSMNREQFRVARCNADLETVPEGVFLILSTSMLGKLKRGLARFVKRTSRKTVPRFRRVGRDNQPVVTADKAYPLPLPPLRYKILDTGTTTRNNIVGNCTASSNCSIINSVNMIVGAAGCTTRTGTRR